MRKNKKIRYAITVTGRVQGVGFRWSTVREAQSTAVKGYVKNMPDGSVYIEAEGSKEQLDALVDWCRREPGPGYVDSVTVDTLSPAGYDEFRVKY